MHQKSDSGRTNVSVIAELTHKQHLFYKLLLQYRIQICVSVQFKLTLIKINLGGALVTEG